MSKTIKTAGKQAKRWQTPRGNALFLGLIGTTIAVTMMFAVIELSSDNQEKTEIVAGHDSAYYAGLGAVELAVSDLLGQFNKQDPASADYTTDLVAFMNNKLTWERANGTDLFAKDLGADTGKVIERAVTNRYKGVSLAIGASARCDTTARSATTSTP